MTTKLLAVEALAIQLQIEAPQLVTVRELQFAKALKRRWRFDFACPELMLAAEVEGATWVQGRHTRGAGYEKDCEKYNTAILLGWRVLRFTSGMVERGEAIATILQAVAQHEQDQAA